MLIRRVLAARERSKNCIPNSRPASEVVMTKRLLFDHCLLLHPEQIARIESKLPAYTVGSLQRKSQMDVLLEFITSLLEFPDPGDKLKELGELIKDVFQLMPSGKHMIGRDLGRLEPTLSLKYCSAG
ncbi:hypothetical protein [Bathymodiolus japonicus methanotrophic gill symbiont]|uniref:hypothetical protein n=1 Tax=Bathymodiolus japonicus methanotrophic gill symbiont TaxID=113269 RepID=UPI001C8E2B46|nr:hypothetical protein [Bathymodiolus japonicus methanotrophic gill symbiont]